MDSLLPLEIELAERFIAHFLGQFEFPATAEHDCVYWVDLSLAQPPLRLASDKDALAAVLAERNVIGYIDADMLDPRAKVLFRLEP